MFENLDDVNRRYERMHALYEAHRMLVKDMFGVFRIAQMALELLLASKEPPRLDEIASRYLPRSLEE